VLYTLGGFEKFKPAKKCYAVAIDLSGKEILELHMTVQSKDSMMKRDDLEIFSGLLIFSVD